MAIWKRFVCVIAVALCFFQSILLAQDKRRLTGFVDTRGGQHVFYLETQNMVNQLFYDSSTNKWINQSLTSLTGGPIAQIVSGLASFDEVNGGQHVYYFGPNNTVNQLFYAPASNNWINQKPYERCGNSSSRICQRDDRNNRSWWGAARLLS